MFLKIPRLFADKSFSTDGKKRTQKRLFVNLMKFRFQTALYLTFVCGFHARNAFYPPL